MSQLSHDPFHGQRPTEVIVDEASAMTVEFVEALEPSVTITRFGPMRDLRTGEVIDPGGCPDEVLARARRSRVEW